MTTDTIAYGESYDISVCVLDADGNEVVLDGTYSAKYRVLSQNGSGTEISAGAMTIADGVATATIDTGDSPWSPGIYFYDVRITDADGHEYVSETIQLVISLTQTQPA